jgi:hypothetical protein
MVRDDDFETQELRERYENPRTHRVDVHHVGPLHRSVQNAEESVDERFDSLHLGRCEPANRHAAPGGGSAVRTIRRSAEHRDVGAERLETRVQL